MHQRHIHRHPVSFLAYLSASLLLIAGCGPVSQPQPGPAAQATASPAGALPGASPSTSPSAAAMPADYVIPLPAGLDKTLPLRVEIYAGEQLAQKAKNDAWRSDCENPTVVRADLDHLLVNGRSLTQAEYQQFTSQCAERERTEVRELAPRRLELPLSADGRQALLPAAGLSERVHLRLLVQPPGTCFRIEHELDFTPGTQARFPVELSGRAAWTPMGPDEHSKDALSCVHGQVSDAKGQPLADALVLLGGLSPFGPKAVHTDAAGHFRMASPGFTGEMLELHAGAVGYRPQHQTLRFESNPDWDPGRNRYDFRLGPLDPGAGDAGFILTSSEQTQFDPDYALQLSLYPLSDSLDDAQSALVLKTLSAAQILAGADFLARGLAPGRPYRLSLRDSSCAPKTFTYYGIADQENRLDTHDWKGISDLVTCFPS
ncbi:MAG TPA: carboxypeptidase-like regulatory domain-containing protein, partial [Candidatus Obscuribacterales bacterium]